jgi:ATP-dependent DNA helicase RecG
VARLQHLVQILARPIEFASRDHFAHLANVKDLGPFVSRRILQVLTEAIYPPRVETDLLALRQLFADFAPTLGPAEQRRRIAGAREILERLKAIDTGHGGHPLGTRCSGECNGYPPGQRVPGERPAAKGEQPSPQPAIRDQPSAGRSNVSPLAAGPAPRAEALSAIPIRYAKGVGPKRAVFLEKLGVRSVEDALWYLPWRYEDRSVVSTVAAVAPGAVATICGTILRAELKQIPRRRLTILEVVLDDATGRLKGVFFNQSYLEKVLKPGVRVMMSGTVTAGRGGWTDLRMESPQYEVLGESDEPTLHVGRIVPIYHETRGLSSRQLRSLTHQLLQQYGAGLVEILPESLRARYGFPAIGPALEQVHFPDASVDRQALERGTTPAHRRLAYEELFVFELALASRHQTVHEEVKGLRFDPQTPLLARVRRLLPFRLTGAQLRVIADIRHDMESSRPMNRLIQGDVGCGKTIVALHAIVLACGSGYQTALMAPTEILAEQHARTLKPYLQALRLNAVLLTSGAKGKARAAALKAIEAGEVQIVIGTHALIQKGVRFAKLGLAVVDEQHKFGVLQRKTLVDKGYRPDVLVMTATPIPRTLAMTVYGDLDVSVIDALPPGRAPITTLLYTEAQRRRAYQVLETEVRAGRQAYIVYPLVEESEKVDLQAAIQGAERLQAKDFRWARVGLLHGRMKSDDKERVMAAFQAGEIQILVATTVVEVGVDVANATVMLVEHAERFGLAQLHQLRGRVGRGTQRSYCLLLTSGLRDRGVRGNALARRRLEALVRSSDGFVIAEEDLRIRGPGEFFGVRQWGVPEFHAANLVRDAALVEEARRDAFALLRSDPHLMMSAHRVAKEAMLRRWGEKLALGAVS